MKAIRAVGFLMLATCACSGKKEATTSEPPQATPPAPAVEPAATPGIQEIPVELSARGRAEDLARRLHEHLGGRTMSYGGATPSRRRNAGTRR